MKDSITSTQKTRIKTTSPEPAKAPRRQTQTDAAAETTPDKKEKKTLSHRLKALFKNQTFRYTLLFLGAMILLYLFSMFGGMLTSPGFTYAEF